LSREAVAALISTEYTGSMAEERRRGKRKISREDVISVGRELFRNKGFHNTSMDDIVTELQLGKGTFYALFESKTDLFLAVIDQVLKDLLDHTDSLIGEEKDPIKRLQIRGLGYIDMYDSYHDLITRLMGETVAGDEPSRMKVSQIYEDMASPIIEDITLARDKGIVEVEDPELAAYVLIGAIEMACYLHQKNHKYDRVRIVQLLTRGFIHSSILSIDT
jgi:AcrR family transcriptional regulator